jgi:hypothetical protein
VKEKGIGACFAIAKRPVQNWCGFGSSGRFASNGAFDSGWLAGLKPGAYTRKGYPWRPEMSARRHLKFYLKVAVYLVTSGPEAIEGKRVTAFPFWKFHDFWRNVRTIESILPLNKGGLGGL